LELLSLKASGLVDAGAFKFSSSGDSSGAMGFSDRGTISHPKIGYIASGSNGKVYTADFTLNFEQAAKINEANHKHSHAALNH
jgi:hypothetical protein